MEPELLKEVANGEKYLIKNGSDYIYILNIRGSHY
jgi:hypothetical protein